MSQPIPVANTLRAAPPEFGPTLRWQSRVSDLAAIERELARIWAETRPTATGDGVDEQRVAARTSVLNLVVIASQPEVGERCVAVVGHLTGRHPSRILIIAPSDPDGPSWIDAEILAHCILPRQSAAETCSEQIYLRAGGESGRHLAAIMAPLLIHDLPVTVWWPGDVPFASAPVRRVLELTDRIVVDGSSWPGDGLDRLRQMAELLEMPNLTLSDFSLIRQSRWREAIASTFDHPDLQPYLRALRRILVTYAAGDEAGLPGPPNLVRPLYHLAWLASRLGLSVQAPLRPATGDAQRGEQRGERSGILRSGRRRIEVALRPEISTARGGSTLRVELEGTRRGSTLRVAVTGQAESITVDAWLDDQPIRHRPFLAPRRTEVDMLTEVIESIGASRLSAAAIRMAAALVGPGSDVGATR